jgi:hypothetical protein
MEVLKTLAALGFWFFLIKGLLWLLLFGLAYYGLLDKTKFNQIKDKLGKLRKKRE